MLLYAINLQETLFFLYEQRERQLTQTITMETNNNLASPSHDTRTKLGGTKAMAALFCMKKL